MRTFLYIVFAIVSGIILPPAIFIGHVPLALIGSVLLILSLILGPND